MSPPEPPPSPARRRWWVLAGIVLAAVATVAAILFLARPDPGGPTYSAASWQTITRQPHLTFLNTAEPGYGRLAAVPLADPTGARAVGDVGCERQFSRGGLTSCLSSEYQLTATYQANILDQDLTETAAWSLPGAPSRTTISPDGQLVSTTVFVAGDSYATDGFSTRTVIRSVTGGEPNTGSLERFSFTKDGKPYTAQDLNLWGVTFTPDSRNFYVSVATAGVVYLAKGDLAARTVEFLRPNVECPSLSPDGTTIVYKYPIEGQWRFHAVTVATGADRELGETRSVDDQVRWLDDTHVMYGVPRPNAFPAMDVYSLPTDGRPPTLLIENASSPSVVSDPA